MIARFWEEVWNQRDFSHLDELLTEDFVLHVAGADFAHVSMMAVAFRTQWFDPFPDLRVRTVVQVATDGLVAESLVFTGTHTGTAYHPGLFHALGLPAIPASGAEIEFTQTCVSRLSGARIAEMWEDFDRIRLFLQLGATLGVPGA